MPAPRPDGSRTAELLHELVRAQTRFPALFAEPGEARALFTLDGSLVRTNEVAFALLACDPDDVLGSAMAAIQPACSDVAVRRSFARAAGGQISDVGARLAPRDGRPSVEFAVTLSPAVVDETIVGVYATGRNVTLEQAEERTDARRMAELSSLFEHHADAMIALDATGRTVSINPAFERLTGFADADVVGRPYSIVVAPEALAQTVGLFAHALAGESVLGGTVFLRRDGTRIEVAGMGVPIVVDGDVVGVYAIGRDVTEERRLERDAREQSERMRELYLVAASTGQSAEAQIHAALALGRAHMNCHGAYLTRVEGGVASFVSCSGTVPYAEGAQVPLAELPQCASVAALPPLGADGAATDGYTFIGAPSDVGGMRFGAVCFFASAPRIDAFSAADRDFVRLIGALAASAIERGEQRRRLDAFAFFDALTGLPNRPLLDDRLAQAIAQAQRDRGSLAVHFYDLDGFKAINDEHGHLRGDEALRIIGHRLERVTRDVDTVARVGGDEFVVVQPDISSRDDAVVLAQRLREAIAETFSLDGSEHRITASGGIAFFHDDGRDAETLLSRADAALYRVKATGRDGIAFAAAPPPVHT